MLKILALNVSLRPESKNKMFPIGIAYVLSAMKRAGFGFELLDMDMDGTTEEQLKIKLAEKEWDAVVFGSIVTGYPIVKRLAKTIREVLPDTYIVAGNTVVSSIPRISLENTDIDIAVIAEGDVTIVEVLKAIDSKSDLAEVLGIWYKDNGKVIENPRRPIIDDLDSIPNIDYELFDVRRYIDIATTFIPEPLPAPRDKLRAFFVNTARGCIAKCTFCYHCFYGEKYRYRSARNIVDEMKFLHAEYGVNYYNLNDDLTFFSLARIQEFSELLISEGLNIYWRATCRGNLFTSDEHIEVIKLVKQSGCVSLGFSLESANAEILKSMKKNVDLKSFAKQVELMKKAGLDAVTSIVLGYPEETVETIAETYGFCLKVGIYPSSGFLLPQPGTPVYEWCIEHGYIENEEEFLMKLGDRQDLRINLTQMSDEVFVETVHDWLVKLNRELKLGLDEGSLIKTGFYRSKKK